MGHDIFISYSSQDLSMAKDICQKLEETGLTCWMAPRNIDTGISFAKAIIEGIKNGHCLLLIYTAHSNISEQVLREVDRAVHFEKKLLVFKLNDQKYSDSLEYYLCKADSIDATKGNYLQYLKQIEQKVTLLTKVKPDPQLAPKSRHSSTNHPIIKRNHRFFFIFVLMLLLMAGGGVYFQEILLNQTVTPDNDPSPSELVKSNKVMNRHFPLPDDLYQKASEKMYDENLIAKIAFEDLKLLSRQIQSRGGIFFKNSRAGLMENQLSDMEKNNLDLIDHFIIFKLSASLPENLCKKFCLSIVGQRQIQTNEYHVLKDLENILVKKNGIKAQKLFKTMMQKMPDECLDLTFVPIEIGFDQSLELDIHMKIFGPLKSIHQDYANDSKIKIELIKTADDNARIQVFFSKEENLIDLIKRYVVHLCESTR
ncbi:MAG: hypothetical protein A2381_13370 [Bdellovibrionales bacterium RIFOXYB1_FULL_37_110]|nr:MAG: hypothetical protein A2181_02695 [Bdellovibrionales bacterium RIFOXYA1_FULL_38_20]OFZ51692.1 MAG: hypothetical protein A2417_13030 [Bdellovibrionales bacterium RIFOXYC1_FULL_37_79]OFZ60519.1 MAG: hypothetical protein A2381_13370 [Bdellovibrionales bacterium RIFOXYB1_FULL_37_110]OFZ65093.1 MAG: hypothetical protein A2577_09635 [Bdellovibrionales bacterium RIFOXYD1_FULL_36_51]